MAIIEDMVTGFKSSMERCQADPNFLNLFYEKFIISHPEVREKFAHTNMEGQKAMLHASLYMIMLSAQGNDAASIYLDRVAKRHSKTELDIKPEFYNLWLDTLLEAVKETDPEYTEAVGAAWRKMLTHGIDYMKSRYDEEA